MVSPEVGIGERVVEEPRVGRYRGWGPRGD